MSRNPVGKCNSCGEEQAGLAVMYNYDGLNPVKEDCCMCKVCKPIVWREAMGPGQVLSFCFGCVHDALRGYLKVQK